jgi:hypothetical protein
MADQLYLSLWYPNFRLQSLPAALTGVLRQFALIAQDGKPNSELGRVVAASSYPIDWTESPVYQRIYVNDERAEASADTEASLPENAVAEATEQMHEDSAYEFEMQWMLWLPVPANADSGPHEFKDDPDLPDPDAEPEPPRTGAWRLQPSRVRIIGFGPEFDEGSYEQNGHIRVDFGLDTPWVLDDELAGDPTNQFAQKLAAKHIQQNVEKLLAFTLSVEKHCGISSRLLWTESGEPLAEKLIARLQRLN